MRLIIQILLVISFFNCLHAQPDTLRQLNAKGRKSGYWPVFIDSVALKCDSASAYFVAYEFYANGKNTFNFYTKKWKRNDSVVFSGNSTERGMPGLVSGKFTWYDKKDQMITFEENYQNGLPVKFKEVRYKRKGRNYTWAFIRTLDFKKRYHAIPGSYYIQEQNNQAIYNMEEWANFWYRPGKRGWKKYKIQRVNPL